MRTAAPTLLCLAIPLVPVLALAGLAGFTAPSPPQAPPALLDVHVSPTGTTWRLERVDGATLAIDPQGTSAEAFRFALPPEAAGATIRNARVATQTTAEGGERPVLALDLAQGDASAIHVAMLRADAPREWSLSRPIVRTEGDPFRIAELVGIGTDSLDLTLRRGWLSYLDDGSAPEVLVFTDSCGPLPDCPACALVDVGSGRRIPLGSTL